MKTINFERTELPHEAPSSVFWSKRYQWENNEVYLEGLIHEPTLVEFKLDPVGMVRAAPRVSVYRTYVQLGPYLKGIKRKFLLNGTTAGLSQISKRC